MEGIRSCIIDNSYFVSKRLLAIYATQHESDKDTRDTCWDGVGCYFADEGGAAYIMQPQLCYVAHPLLCLRGQ